LFVASANALVNRSTKQLKIAITTIGQTLLLYKVPITLNQIQIRRLTRQENQLYVQERRMPSHPIVTLIRRIVQNNPKLTDRMMKTQFA